MIAKDKGRPGPLILRGLYDWPGGEAITALIVPYVGIIGGMMADSVRLTGDEELIARYLARLERAARHLPPDRREQILVEITDHYL